MNRKLGSLALGSLFAIAVFCIPPGRPPAVSADPPVKPPEITLPVTDAKPEIDGKVEDPCWKEAAEIRLENGAKTGRTSARLCRDADNLYIAIASRLSGPIPKAAKPEERDHLALLINSNGDGNSYYLVSIYPDGSLQTSYREESPPWYDVTWRPKLEVKVRAGEREWIAEVALPFTIFTLNKSLAPVIGFNVRRHDAANLETHSWSPEFSRPGGAGRLKGIPARTYPVPEEPAPLELGPGSAHPGTTGEVKLELEGFLMGGDPHARGVIWDLAVNEKTGELYVLSVPRVRNPSEVQVFDRQGKYLRTVAPFNPTLPREKVKDLALRTAVEGGTKLVLPKHFEIFGAVETSLYGEWWHFPQKIALAPNGDLIMANLYRGTLWRLRPDGSLPSEGWTSVLSPERNEPFESTVDIGVKHHGGLNALEEWYAERTDSYLPFPELFYPYMGFDRDGNLCISRGLHYKSSGLDSLAQYSRFWEVPRNFERQLPDTAAVWWKMRLLDGVKIDNVRGYGFDGKEEPPPPPGGVPGRKETSAFLGECGLAFDGDRLVLSDRKEGRLLVFDADRRRVATLNTYQAEGKSLPFSSPTAVSIDNQGCVYVLVGDGEKKKKVIKLRSWREPELLAASGPLHRETLQIALDRAARPPIVWVANGDGPGSLVKLAGDDLSVKGKWGDTGETLSSPVQQGYVPILNIDPETGHLYVEDDSHFRFGKRGETYRLEQDGKILKRLNSDPKEMPRLETLFGKDGKLYWWEKGKISRSDRTGKPLPFTATGSEILTVDKGFHHVGVYMGMDVDADGNIYYVNAKSHLDVYDSDGNLKKKGFLNLNGAVRGIQVDGQGHIYALSRRPPNIVSDTILEVYKSPLLRLSQYSPGGGEPLWSIPWTGITGRDQILIAGCGCLRPRLHQALDGKGYLYAANWNSVRVVDCNTGKVVGEFGSYGNMDCQGKGSKFPHPELPFGTISALAVWKDRLFVVDQLNRRIVKCKIVYRP